MKKGRFKFIDGLTRLFSPPIKTTIASHQSRILDPISPQLARGLIQSPSRPPPPVTATPSSENSGRYISPSGPENVMDNVYTAISRALSSFQPSSRSTAKGNSKIKPRLIVEGLDVLLSSTGIEELTLENTLYGLRELVSTMVILISADSALIGRKPTAATELEVSHARLLISLAHVADAVVGLRLLDTGVARDISGVFRVTRGTGDLIEGEVDRGMVEEKELLWFEGDNGVKIFGRGAGGA